MWLRRTKHNDHEIAEPNEAGRDVGVVAQARGPGFSVDSHDMAILGWLAASRLGLAASIPGVAIMRLHLGLLAAACRLAVRRRAGRRRLDTRGRSRRHF
jgi:hypothetical protein